MTHRHPIPTFAEACESVLRDPGESHSLYTTLAPVYDRMMGDVEDHYDQQFRTVAQHVPQTAETVLEVGCGVGRLLPLLEARFPHVVGLDVHPELLRFAERRVRHAMLIEGDVVNFDFDRRFDVVVAFEYVTSHLTTDEELAACFESVRAHLEPDGVFVFDAVVDPVAVEEDAVGVFTGRGYRLERAVDVAPMPECSGVELRTDYRVTDIAGDRQATAREHVPVRVFDVDELQTALRAAGFDSVTVDTDASDKGSVVVVARP